MVDAAAGPAKETPLAQLHAQLGASFTDFAGWQMPVRYTSDLEEHRAVRERAGIFDLSHMGEIRVRGSEAGQALDYALAGAISKMPNGRAKYTLLLTPEGGVIDDLIVYRLAEDDYLVVANASNADTDFATLRERAAGFAVTVSDESAQTALIAVQGPESEDIVTRALAAAGSDLTAADISALGYYRFLAGTYADAPLLLARTGYTGEDGFELYVPVTLAENLWQLLTEHGGEALIPCGLACRDTLRLEAGMPLYGHELSTQTLPAQAGLGRVVNYKTKGDFVGRAALESADTAGLPVLVGLRADGRRAGRAGYAVQTPQGETIGEVTSGALSPTLGYPIAMAYVTAQHAQEGTELAIDVRGKALAATVVALPFYSRA
ncbi:glycine cleavage system aminomethyltransferase GcvT [Dermabacteraceae bacterium P7054]